MTDAAQTTETPARRLRRVRLWLTHAELTALHEGTGQREKSNAVRVALGLEPIRPNPKRPMPRYTGGERVRVAVWLTPAELSSLRAKTGQDERGMGRAGLGLPPLVDEEGRPATLGGRPPMDERERRRRRQIYLTPREVSDHVLPRAEEGQGFSTLVRGLWGLPTDGRKEKPLVASEGPPHKPERYILYLSEAEREALDIPQEPGSVPRRVRQTFGIMW